MSASRQMLQALLFLCFASGSTGYHNDGKAVYYKSWNEGSGGRESKLDANPSTFKVLRFHDYAKDDKVVFYKGEIIIPLSHFVGRKGDPLQ